MPDGVAGVIELTEDRVTGLALAPESAAAGVVLETFGAALRRDPEVFRAALERGPALADDKFAQMARAAWRQGVHLSVPDRVRLDRPILIRWLAGVPERALLTRTLVRLGAGARATLVEELLPSGPEIDCAAGETVPQGLFAGTMEVDLGDDAELAVASIQALGSREVAFQHRTARLGEAASLRWALGQLGGRLIRSRVDNRLEGDRSSVEQVEIVFGTEEQLFDLTSYTRHLGRDTTGDLLAKAALRGAARSFMKGLITIERSANGTDSFLGEFGMNLSKKTRSVAIPSLEIDQPDCRRAAHSSSVGPIDEGQVFYLESRGIPDDEARKFIVLGFLEPVVAGSEAAALYAATAAAILFHQQALLPFRRAVVIMSGGNVEPERLASDHDAWWQRILDAHERSGVGNLVRPVPDVRAGIRTGGADPGTPLPARQTGYRCQSPNRGPARHPQYSDVDCIQARQGTKARLGRHAAQAIHAMGGASRGSINSAELNSVRRLF